MSAPLEDYAMIGDAHTAALVARDGSVDWLCWPRFDLPACFAALLGNADNGHWRIAPIEKGTSRRRYRPDTLILETQYETAGGAATIIDFMPLKTPASHIVRLVRGDRGVVPFAMNLTLRFDYGASVPWVTQLEDGPGISAVAGPNMAVLRTPVPLRGEGPSTVAEFSVRAGETIPFVMSYARSHRQQPAPIDTAAVLAETEALWTAWAAKCTYDGPWKEAVVRSVIVLKALTFYPTGGIVAAPTTSLPEQLGGIRNWDYRYCWLRDATITLLSLMNAGYHDEAEAWRGWLLRAVAGSPAQMQIMYGIAGERQLLEWSADWLPGYGGAKPVRIGNAAAQQLQLDVYGEVMDALHHARGVVPTHDDAAWAVQTALVEHLSTIWQQPDEGIWEVRGGRRHFTYSKVMAWVALDRAVQTAEAAKIEAPLARWREIRQRIHDDVCANGFDTARNTFVQSYGGTDLDASLLQIPLVGFLPPSDPRVRGTMEAVRRELMADGFVRRYDLHHVEDGLPPGEGAFLACTFWLADNLVLMDELDEAHEIFERLLSLRNDLGLLAEEYDPAARRMVGNFPQAFSHVAIINTAMNLHNHHGPAKQRAQHPPRATAGPSVRAPAPMGVQAPLLGG